MNHTVMLLLMWPLTTMHSAGNLGNITLENLCPVTSLWIIILLELNPLILITLFSQ